MLVISLALSVVLIGISVAAAARAKDPNRTYWRCWIGLILAVIPCFLFFPAYTYHALAMGLFASVCSLAHVRRSFFLVGTLSIPIAVYGIVVYPVWLQVQEAVLMYRPESLENRLAYEKQYYAAVGRPVPQPLNEDEHWRSLWEAPYEAKTRSYALKALHDDSTQLFVSGTGLASVGCGV